MHRFAIADLPRTPWKNGGGSTREVVCQPPGTGMEAFDWRVSIATIAQPGPFSVFTGIDRTILLLDGDGVRLHAPGHFDHRLDVPGQPFAFAGDVAVDCTLLGGESTDFNVMTRRGVARSDVQLHTGRATLAPATAGVLLALDGDWSLNDGNTLLDVPAGQGVWWANAPTAWACSARQPQARLLSVRITPVRS
ncbi:HutD family protein [Curvibacter sp. APW13]|uniref:HutD/Ves family protein n=1 Tax=Curvibacter sp. APW13 TaxID=3077236 RepID=UPI0039655BD9